MRKFRGLPSCALREEPEFHQFSAAELLRPHPPGLESFRGYQHSRVQCQGWITRGPRSGNDVIGFGTPAAATGDGDICDREQIS